MPEQEIPSKAKETIKDIYKFYVDNHLEFIKDSLIPHALCVTWLSDNEYRLRIDRLEFDDKNNSWTVIGYVFDDFVIIDDDDIEYAVKKISNQYNGVMYKKNYKSEIDEAIDKEMANIEATLLHCSDCHERPDITSYYHSKLLEITLKCPKCGLTKKEKYIIDDPSNVHFAFKDSSGKWNDQIREYVEDDLNDVLDTAKDIVNHPDHYTQGGIECIDAMQASMSVEGFRDYCKGNVLKYIWRYRDKNGVEDLKKAQWYLNKLISTFEGGEK